MDSHSEPHQEPPPKLNAAIQNETQETLTASPAASTLRLASPVRPAAFQVPVAFPARPVSPQSHPQQAFLVNPSGAAMMMMHQSPNPGTPWFYAAVNHAAMTTPAADSPAQNGDTDTATSFIANDDGSSSMQDGDQLANASKPRTSGRIRTATIDNTPAPPPPARKRKKTSPKDSKVEAEEIMAAVQSMAGMQPAKKAKRSSAKSSGTTSPAEFSSQALRAMSRTVSRGSSSRNSSVVGNEYYGAITEPLNTADYSQELIEYMIQRQAQRRKALKEYRNSETSQKTRIYQRILGRIREGRDHVFNEMTRDLQAAEESSTAAPITVTDKDANGTAVLAEAVPQTEEEVEFRRRQIWAQICELMPRLHNARIQSLNNSFTTARTLSRLCQRASSRRLQNCKRPVKEAASRAKRAYKEMLVFWKKNEKEERELRKKAEKEEVERRRREEEEREKRRQARKLNFLISQTELYSHFFAKKLGMDTEAPDIAQQPKSKKPTASIATTATGEIDFDAAQEDELHALAQQQAENALAEQRARTQKFDSNVKRSDPSGSSSSAKPVQAADLDFQNPSIMPGAVEIKQPNMLTCELKPYQIRGLNWLGNLYEQGINGILADDMGLGKTVQSISLMSWLAETHNIWGPFLVISPASTLHNWQQEITRFAPQLKCLPYWGSVKDRKVLRKFWSSKKLSTRDAPFHILVTSYQIVVTDQQYFQRQRWQYMILDEAHAIKSSSTARWKILLNFNCRNRLLLTGTPVQNSMQELWALLHFIMPTFFDSHEEFSEWFSKDIESHATDKNQLNERQLKRLHMILKPFMLRRVKKDVEHELGEKIEQTVYCELTAQQRRMYSALSERVSIDELLEKATMDGKDVEENDHLMNAMVQFRKVCNHPQLFEVAEAESPFVFCMEDLNISTRDLSSFNVPYRCRNPIAYVIPKLLYSNILHGPIDEHSQIINRFSIWNPSHIHSSLIASDSAFSFLPFYDSAISDLIVEASASPFTRALKAFSRSNKRVKRQFLEFGDEPASHQAVRRLLDIVPVSPVTRLSDISEGLTTDCISHCKRIWSRILPAYLPKAACPPIDYSCSSRSFAHHHRSNLFPFYERGLIFDLPQYLNLHQKMTYKEADSPILLPPAIRSSPYVPMWVPNPKQLLFQSGKLLELDRLLHELKLENHRVLIYFQMTKMIDLMEEYLAFRQYTYLRLDGSSKISDRRDMVSDWQTKSDIFIFLLSTRAGGLGINLTAADTVIFYDSDWNPTVDQQAMDRAHRLGQTRQVTVYRLITRNTIEERILQRAMEKDEVQKVVMAGGMMQTVTVGEKSETSEPKPS